MGYTLKTTDIEHPNRRLAPRVSVLGWHRLSLVDKNAETVLKLVSGKEANKTFGLHLVGGRECLTATNAKVATEVQNVATKVHNSTL